MKNYKQLFIVLAVGTFIVPQIVLAAWWNPFSWNIFTFFHKTPKIEVVKIATSTIVTSVATTTATSSVDIDAIIKAKVDAQVKATLKTKAEEQAKIDATVKAELEKQALQNTINNTGVGGVNTSGDNRTAGEITQEKANQNTSNKSLQTTSSATASIYTDLKNPSSASGIVTMIPVIIFDVRGQNDTLHLHSLTVHFNVSGTAQNVSGTAQITNAYLYQGNTTPISSALVSGNTATFLIPDNTTGANFGANIPSQFTVKVDTVGTHLIYSKDDSPFSISSSINSSDIQVYDSSDNLVPITGSATGGIRISSGYCGPGCA